MSKKCHGDCQDVGMPVGNRRKPNLMFKCPNAFIFNISNTCMHMHTSFTCDTCGFKTPGNPEIGPHTMWACVRRASHCRLWAAGVVSQKGGVFGSIPSQISQQSKDFPRTKHFPKLTVPSQNCPPPPKENEIPETNPHLVEEPLVPNIVNMHETCYVLFSTVCVCLRNVCFLFLFLDSRRSHKETLGLTGWQVKSEPYSTLLSLSHSRPSRFVAFKHPATQDCILPHKSLSFNGYSRTRPRAWNSQVNPSGWKLDKSVPRRQGGSSQTSIYHKSDEVMRWCGDLMCRDEVMRWCGDEVMRWCGDAVMWWSDV